ncbi:hypothetical protein BCR36DRAFT_346824 [Piromyces finnis]|uniref:Uncharacterized protein n=1 Tax=Piromyces finnis TaxID=1754191 RepID=A0A1Y1VIC2_9FUNG|nr:hypothetical protein BCR36DRAFT_346824 [Piromyces finnis]|eukprot:ORX56134.1 hypothetical protein BCR36DRAFT_346824 [Piromyces finnis]
MKSGNNSTSVLQRTKSKRSDYGKVKKIKKALTKKFNSKSYETISLSKKDDIKKNVITFIHSNGLIQSDVNMKNKKHHINTNDNMNKSDKKREIFSSTNENDFKTRRFSLPSPEVLKNLQSHKNKYSSSPLPIDSINSFSPDKNILKISNLKRSKTTPTSSTIYNTKIRQNDSVKNNSSKMLTPPIKPTVKSPRPKSKLSESVTLPISPSLFHDNQPSAPSLDEMYLEEMKDHQKLLQYKNFINLEYSQYTNVAEENSFSSSLLPPPIPSNDSTQYSSSCVEIKNPFEPPYTTLSPTMTIVTPMTTKSSNDEISSHLPKPSSLSFYTQSHSSSDSVPPKINNKKNGKDYSIEKVIPRIDLISRRDSLDFYFDKLSQPSKPSHLNLFDSMSTSFEPDIPSREVSQHRMMTEPQPNYHNFAHSSFNQVMIDTFNIRNKLEDKIEETKFQMMIAITQINIINEQLKTLNYI